MVTLWSTEAKIIACPQKICIRLKKETNTEAKKEDKYEEEQKKRPLVKSLWNLGLKWETKIHSTVQGGNLKFM